MQHFNPMKAVDWDNYAIQVDYYLNGENIERCERFGSAKEFAEWLDAFDYDRGDVTGWTGDTATMRAVNSFRKNYIPVRAVPEFITEFNTNDGSSQIVGADEFHKVKNIYRKDRKNYRVYHYLVTGARVYAVMYVGDNTPAQLGAYVWHVPFDAEELPIT